MIEWRTCGGCKEHFFGDYAECPNCDITDPKNKNRMRGHGGSCGKKASKYNLDYIEKSSGFNR